MKFSCRNRQESISNIGGFTLIELLVSMAISTILMFMVYSFISNAVRTRGIIEERSSKIVVQSRLSNLINKDFRMAVDRKVDIANINSQASVSISTTNSLYFNKAMAVDVLYFVKDGYLVRYEHKGTIDYENYIKLIPNVSNFTIAAFNVDKNLYDNQSTSNSAMLYKLTFSVGDTPYEIYASVNGVNVEYRYDMHFGS